MSYNSNVARHVTCHKKERGDFLNGNCLKQLRVINNLKQKEMAELVGMTHRTYRAKENGERSVSLEEALRIAEVFGKRIEDIFLHNDDTKRVIRRTS